MQLYGTVNSPFVRHCRIAILQQGYAFEWVDADREAVAKVSPTMKMPYFIDGDLSLTDSSSIVKYLREKAGENFLPALADFERYTVANTVLDTMINHRILAAEGHTPDTINYMGKQLDRAHSGLQWLDQHLNPAADLREDSTLRTACLIDWGLFRQWLDLDGLPRLTQLLATARENEYFLATAPPYPKAGRKVP